MTFAQCSDSAHWSTSSVRASSCDQYHNATDETTTMSIHGPEKDPSVTSPHSKTSHTQDAQTQTLGEVDSQELQRSTLDQLEVGGARISLDARIAVPTHFDEYAEHFRAQSHLENKQRLLSSRKRILQKSIALSARLHRLSSWVRDGLVEISRHSDASGFARAHQHMQDLVDLSYSQWNNELHALDPLEVESFRTTSIDNHPILPRSTQNARADLMALISCLRSDSQFLVARFKALLPSQVSALSKTPRFEERKEPILPSPQGRDRMFQRNLKGFCKNLEDYATSFERDNPLAFLLFNIYGTDRCLAAPENQLRLSTWSTVCADLFLTYNHAYQVLCPQLLSSFALLHEWRVKDAVELFLMDVLQRGAFLLDLASTRNTSAMNEVYPNHTPQAQEFFDLAVGDLFTILAASDGGYPTGSLTLASAVLSKLPPQQQSDFRGDFFSKWFLDCFLRIAITYPENENMLLKFHISRDARDLILLPLWREIHTSVLNVYSSEPLRPVHPQFRHHVLSMVCMLDATPINDPYQSPTKHSVRDASSTSATVTICASEVVRVLEALSPQTMNGSEGLDPVVTSSMSTFQEQYSHLSDKFDRLTRELRETLEPGTSAAASIHPCHEQWLHLDIDSKGQPSEAIPPTDGLTFESDSHIEDLDDAQRAILRLCRDQAPGTMTNSGTTYRTGLPPHQSLTSIFQDLIISTKARGDPPARRYWEKALSTLHRNYPLSRWRQDDTAILRKLYENFQEAQAVNVADCLRLETEVSSLEDVSSAVKIVVTRCVDHFEDLKLKLWYTIDVVNSQFYVDAKNITDALNNMAFSAWKSTAPRPSKAPPNRRPLSIRSATSSLFEQPIADAMGILKAPPEHGGPKKLADKQIENTNKWLQRSNVDNFCRGEERIHRFCMEVFNVSKRLVGESLSDSPVLWSSELFARERTYYDIHTFGVTSAPASTRPASVMSDSFASSLRSSRLVYRSNDSARIALAEDRRSPVRRTSLHGSGSSRIPRDFLVPELASSIGSPGIAFSATTAESISSIWSPLPSLTRSHTSASSFSRPGSMFNDHVVGRFADTAREKTKFLEKAQRTLICLLLSDLGCPVWSLGTETDAWLNSGRSVDDTVNARLNHRILAEKLLGRQVDDTHSNVASKSGKLHRSASMHTPSGKPNPIIADGLNPSNYEPQEEALHIQQPLNTLLDDLGDLLAKLSQQVDPVEKLQIVEEFHNLSLTQLGAESDGAEHENMQRKEDSETSHIQRRRSLELESAKRHKKTNQPLLDDLSSMGKPSEQQIVRQLKLDLVELKPKTLFRDLQYIAAFVPSEVTDKTPQGKCFLHLGLAALAYKDEVCRSMIDIADRIVAKDAATRVPRHSIAEPALTKATEYWMLGAREGNAVAQRELALLYLSHPEQIPIMTPPLVVSAEIFKNDMLWRERDVANPSVSALCLALDWMQRAANNGDRLAQQKLDERRARHSIRR